MIIIRKSMLSGNVSSMDIPVTEGQLAKWQAGTLIQNVMPNLSADQREFILTGITPAEWDLEYAEGDM
jgi:hypothetical protein